MKWFKQIQYYIQRDVAIEWRNKSILASSIVYLISIVFISLHAFEQLDPDVWNALFWIVMVFTILTVVGRSFSLEAEYFLYHYHTIQPSTIISSKLLLNSFYSCLVGLIAYFIFSIFLGNQIQNQTTMLLVLLLGSAGLGITFTLTSAISARSGGNLVLTSILSIPILLPMLIVIVRLTARAFEQYSFYQNLQLFLSLLLLNVIIVIVSYLLFPYLWRD